MIDEKNTNILDLLNMATGGGAGGEDLPEHAAADDGKVLTVQQDGSLGWKTPSDELPAHTASDAGKVPVVQNDNSLAWEDIPTELPAHAVADAGKVLEVQNDNSLAWETPNGGMTVPVVPFTTTEDISNVTYWSHTMTAAEETAWANVKWREPGQIIVLKPNKATFNANDRRGNFVIRDSNGDLVAQGFVGTETALQAYSGAVLASTTGNQGSVFLCTCYMSLSNSRAMYQSNYELPAIFATDPGKVLTVDANKVPQWSDPGIVQPLNMQWAGNLYVGSTEKTGSSSRKQMILNRDFHGYVFEHALTGAITSTDEVAFRDFMVPEGCREVYVYTKADGESSWTQRANIKNLKPYQTGAAASEVLSWDGDNPQMIVYHDFATVLGVALASGDHVRTVFVQDNGLDLDAVFPAHAAADDGKVLTVQQDGTLAWETPAGGGAAVSGWCVIEDQYGNTKCEFEISGTVTWEGGTLTGTNNDQAAQLTSDRGYVMYLSWLPFEVSAAHVDWTPADPDDDHGFNTWDTEADTHRVYDYYDGSGGGLKTAIKFHVPFTETIPLNAPVTIKVWG